MNSGSNSVSARQDARSRPSPICRRYEQPSQVQPRPFPALKSGLQLNMRIAATVTKALEIMTHLDGVSIYGISQIKNKAQTVCRAQPVLHCIFQLGRSLSVPLNSCLCVAVVLLKRRLPLKQQLKTVKNTRMRDCAGTVILTLCIYMVPYHVCVLNVGYQAKSEGRGGHLEARRALRRVQAQVARL